VIELLGAAWRGAGTGTAWIDTAVVQATASVTTTNADA
jgi:hypothetical protein